MRKGVEEALRAAFRPEFLNRIDEVIIFHRLSREHMERIAGIQFERLARRLEARGIRAEISDGAKSALAERGYDPVFGARPLKRLLQKEVENVLARRILAGDFGEGDTVRVDAHEGAFTFRRGA
jgi:ATP-dependent Clp protease ATP-binding subunit ClpB